MNRRRGMRIIGPVLSVALAAAACNQVSDFLSEDPEHLLILRVERPVMPADGASVSNVQAKIPAGTPVDERLISFSTTAGAFLDPNGGESTSLEIRADSSGVAVAQLRSSTVAETAELRARSDAGGDRSRVKFTYAAPVRIDVTPDKVLLQIAFADTALITATLRTNTGFATKGTPVEFTASDPQGGAVGGFASVSASGDNGEATAVYDPAGTAFRGTVTVRARAQDPATGAFIEGTTTVEVAD